MYIARTCIALACGLVLGACSHSGSTKPAAASGAASSGAERANRLISGLCPAVDATHRATEEDTSGDGVPDVRRVFLIVGTGDTATQTLVCREVDLNGDGRPDVVRHYDDEGRVRMEEADRNFDGKMDDFSYFAKGRVVREELDTNHDGRIDTKYYFDNGERTRAELDTLGRSTADDWRPNVWEYYAGGRLLRVGTDLDGDGKVDRWDRDAPYQAELAAARAKAEKDEAAEEGESSSSAGGAGESDASASNQTGD
ncbi:MAG: hypothetical protein KC543_09940 [Myxococcales bacterium]|nr:hypothetical protein [Myxococcales bacterium]